MRCGEERLRVAFYEAALFLKDMVDNHGWKPSSNYLREHVRCATGLRFSNTVSPQLLRWLRRTYPELRAYLEIGTLKER